jgi:hypothetical protein
MLRSVLCPNIPIHQNLGFDFINSARFGLDPIGIGGGAVEDGATSTFFNSSSINLDIHSISRFHLKVTGGPPLPSKKIRVGQLSTSYLPAISLWVWESILAIVIF